MKTILILPDGTQITSSAEADRSVLSFQLTESVNAQQELTLGSCCSAMAQISIFEQQQIIFAGDELQILRTDGENTVSIGLFTAQRPSRSGSITKITAYDRVTWLDRDVSKWLEECSWPVCLLELAKGVCAQCGLELENTSIPNGDYEVERFSASGVTGRQLMQWIGQACGCFCKATREGRLVLSWYEPRDLAFTPGGQYYYYQNSLTMEQYTVAPVEKVQLAQTAADVGVVWPNVTGAVNTYVIRGNPLLAAAVTEKTEPLAKTLYSRLSQVTYCPCRLTVAEECGVAAGDIVTVDGQTVYVMSTRLQSGRLEIKCTGSPDRNNTAAVNQYSYKALSGRVLEIDGRVEGLTAENRDSAGKLARLSLTVDGLSTQVSTGEQLSSKRLTKLEQDAQELRLQVEQGPDHVKTTTGYTFGADGMRIAKSGTEMENLLDHTGMYVTRSGEVILQANNRGVTATDVQVRNYLNIGLHARLEDYAGRTACFYIN